MRLKTASLPKEATYGKMKRHEEQIKENLKAYANPFHGAPRNVATWVEVPVSIANGVLSSREKGEEYFKKFIEKRLTSPEKEFYEPIKRSGIKITIEKKKKPRTISILEENRQALGFFVAKYPVKKETFSYPLTSYPLALSASQGTLYKPRRKYLFKNYLIHYCAAFAEIHSVKSSSDLWCYSRNSFCSITTNMGRFVQNSY